MAWLMLAAAAACMVLAGLLSAGTPAVLLLLLAALLLLLQGTLRLLGERQAALARTGAQMLDPAELGRLREQIEARRGAATHADETPR